MAFEMKNFMVFKKIVLPQSQTEKECSVETEGDLSKILTATSQVSLCMVEVGEGVITYTAELNNCVVYATSDGKIGNSDYVCDITGKIENAAIKSEDKAILSLSVQDVKVDYVSGTVTVKVTICENVELLSQREVKSVDASDDDICMKKSSQTIEKFVGCGKSEGVTEEEFVARGNVKKIISVEPNVFVKNADSENGIVSVTGETIARIVYLTTDDKFEVAYTNTAFKEEIEVEDSRQDMKAVAKACVKRRDCRCEVLESDKSTKIAIKIPFMVNAYVFGSEEIESIEDAYCTKSEISMTSDSFDMTKVCQSQILESKIDGSLSLSDDKPRVDKIIFSGGEVVNVTNSYISNKEIFVEGIAKTTVVYLNDEEGSLNSVEIEIPFALSEKTSASEQAVVCADAVIYDADVTVRRGRELVFDAKVKANARICEDEVSATITDLKKGEVYEDKDYAMQYVLGKAGETSWDIAKRNKVKEEQIIAQNQEVVFPLIQDTGFILFFQKLM